MIKPQRRIVLNACSVSVIDFLMDSQLVLVPFMVPGILNAPPDGKHAELSAFAFTKYDSQLKYVCTVAS
jgi:hypothetical protein